MEQNKTFLGTEPVGKLLFKLAIPTVLAQLVNMLYNVVDRIYIGHIPEVGSLALTGVGVCMPILMIVSAFAALIGYGGAPKATIFMGKGDQTAAEKIMGGCLTLQLILSVILTVVLLLWNREFLLLFGASDNTIDYACAYLTVYAIGTVFVQLTMGMGAFINAQGFTNVGMMTVLIGAVSNIILDPIFIFVFDMGVRGAALATILSQAISCVWVMCFLLGKKTGLKLKAKNLIIDAKLVFPCVVLGLSTFIMQSSDSVISVCFNASALKYGGDIAVGAMTILTSVVQFALLPMYGIAQGAQPISSYNFGAGKIDRVKQAFRLQLISCSVVAVLLWLGIMFCPQVFAGIFTPDKALIAFTAKAMRVYGAAMCLFGIQVACQMTFVSTGNALCSIIVAIVRKFVLLLPLIYLVPLFMADKVMGVYLAESIADVLAIAFTATLFAVQFKKAIHNLQR